MSAGGRQRPRVAPVHPGAGAVVPRAKLRPPGVEVRVVEDGGHVRQQPRRLGVADWCPLALVDGTPLVAVRGQCPSRRALPDGRRVAQRSGPEVLWMLEKPSSPRGLRSTREALQGKLHQLGALICQTTAVRLQPREAVWPAQISDRFRTEAVREHRPREGVAGWGHHDEVIEALGDVLEEALGHIVIQEVVSVAAPHGVDFLDAQFRRIEGEPRVGLQQRLLEGVSHVRPPLDPGKEVQSPQGALSRDLH